MVHKVLYQVRRQRNVFQSFVVKDKRDGVGFSRTVCHHRFDQHRILNTGSREHARLVLGGGIQNNKRRTFCSPPATVGDVAFANNVADVAAVQQLLDLFKWVNQK